MKKLIFCLAAALASGLAFSQSPAVGSKPAVVELKDKLGGLVTGGGAWSSSSLKDAVYMLVYVDPDMKDLNEALSERLKQEKFDRSKFKSVAVINLKATWKPNAIISSMLKEKQKEFPDTIYVKDYEGVLVKEWQLADDNYDVILFDQRGSVLFRKDGKLDAKDIDAFVALIAENIKGGTPSDPSSAPKP